MEAKTKETKSNLRLWFFIILIIAVVIRVLLFLVYPAVSYSDTASYRRSADAILGGFQAYDGTRTPGYPAFMGLIGPDRAVYAAQLFLGLGITLGWFLIGWKASGKPWFGAVVGLAHTLNPGQFFFEANLLTETLCTFLLMAALLGAFLWLHHPRYQTIWMALAIGLASSLATLTRPLFIFMPVWFAIFLAFSIEDKKIHFNWRPLLGILLPAILLVGGWMRWIQSNYHVFSLTTMTGYHLVQHTGYYFEDVPDEHAVLREVYLDYRQARMAERGTQGNTIWDAIPAMQEATGMNFYELSRVLQGISIDLILTHPWQYLSRVLRGWWLFWRAPVYWDASALASTSLAAGLSAYILFSRALVFGMNLLFILTSLAALFSKKFRQTWDIGPFHWLVAGSIWATSILSSLIDHGDNPRFLVPLQSMVVYWVLWIGLKTWQAWGTRKNKLESTL
jgi:4-amino-4-deoxy-L-arabinose transferase-like glycosyltransferase